MAPSDREWLARYHDPALLDQVRILRARPPHPGMSGITYGDVILIDPAIGAESDAWHRLLFHELVHVVQYAVLGIDEFIARYLGGWVAAGYRYQGIPLERDAYAIEAMLADGRADFPVRAEVELRLAAATPGSGAGGGVRRTGSRSAAS